MIEYHIIPFFETNKKIWSIDICYFVICNLQWLALLTVYHVGSSHVSLVSVPRKMFCVGGYGGCVRRTGIKAMRHAVNRQYRALLLFKATFFDVMLTQATFFGVVIVLIVQRKESISDLRFVIEKFRLFRASKRL
jgi:hypothetical protein